MGKNKKTKAEELMKQSFNRRRRLIKSYKIRKMENSSEIYPKKVNIKLPKMNQESVEPFQEKIESELSKLPLKNISISATGRIVSPIPKKISNKKNKT